jgi:hypothetical protein
MDVDCGFFPAQHLGHPRKWEMWQIVNAILYVVRTQAGRDPKPSAGIMDSQSVKTSEGGEQRGVDVHKQTPGRKRLSTVSTIVGVA